MQGNHTPSWPSVFGYDRNVQNFDLPVRFQNNPKYSGEQILMNQPDIIPSDRNKIQTHPQICKNQDEWSCRNSDSSIPYIMYKFINSPIIHNANCLKFEGNKNIDGIHADYFAIFNNGVAKGPAMINQCIF